MVVLLLPVSFSPIPLTAMLVKVPLILTLNDKIKAGSV